MLSLLLLYASTHANPDIHGGMEVMNLTEAERRVLRALSMMHSRNGILIPDQQALGDSALQRLCAEQLVEKCAEREGFHRYKVTDSGRSLATAASHA